MPSIVYSGREEGGSRAFNLWSLGQNIITVEFSHKLQTQKGFLVMCNSQVLWEHAKRKHPMLLHAFLQEQSPYFLMASDNYRTGHNWWQAWCSASPRGQWRTGKMEKTGGKIICGAPVVLTVKGLMIMMMMMITTYLTNTNFFAYFCHKWMEILLFL